MVEKGLFEKFKQLRDEIYSELPDATHKIDKIESYDVKMRDGVVLRTKVYFPVGESVCPVILMRNPYPYLFEMFEATSSIFVEHGYILVIQDCRGTGASKGEWIPYFNERNDGIDTLDWIVKQQWQDGNIGMFGMSYSSYVQWIIADVLPKEVKTLMLDVFGTERYDQMYMNGMFRHDIYTSWAFFNSGITTSDDPDELYQKSLYIRPHMDVDKQLLGSELKFYREFITNVDRNNEYWENGVWATLRNIPQKVNVPLLLTDGWFDHHIDGLIKGYLKLKSDIRKQSRLVLGPWDHIKNSPGELDYPNSNIVGTLSIKAGLEWFDHFLKGKTYDKKLGIIDAYSIGTGNWQEFETWPPKTERETFYLAKEDLPYKGGVLTNKKPELENNIKYIYNPDEYVMTNGGSALFEWISTKNYGIKHGACLQGELGERENILTFISKTFEERKDIVGNVKFCLTVSTDAKDTAFAVKLMEVFPDGRTFNICDGISSLVYRNNSEQALEYIPKSIVQIKIEAWPISWSINRGSKLRMDISSSNFPAYNNHLNGQGVWCMQKDAIVANQTVYTGKNKASYVEIPIKK
jgi:putative CocE/NonD family hydrolase